VKDMAEASACVSCRDSLSAVMLDFYYRMDSQ
jgi:hypothetical protein